MVTIAFHSIVINSRFKGDVALESNISQYSQRVASGIAKLCRTAPRLKGDDWEDPNDPNVIAEKELLRAAKAIDAAASKLSNLTPRKEANSKVIFFSNQLPIVFFRLTKILTLTSKFSTQQSQLRWLLNCLSKKLRQLKKNLC